MKNKKKKQRNEIAQMEVNIIENQISKLEKKGTRKLS